MVLLIIYEKWVGFFFVYLSFIFLNFSHCLYNSRDEVSGINAWKWTSLFCQAIFVGFCQSSQEVSWVCALWLWLPSVHHSFHILQHYFVQGEVTASAKALKGVTQEQQTHGRVAG